MKKRSLKSKSTRRKTKQDRPFSKFDTRNQSQLKVNTKQKSIGNQSQWSATMKVHRLDLEVLVGLVQVSKVKVKDDVETR